MIESSLPEESLFAQALEIASPAERAAFLDQACGQDAALRAGVEALLRAHEKGGDLLDLPATTGLPATATLPTGEGPGTVLGPYKLLEPIGEGGMGTVFMAEQEQPIRRRVAVKVVKAGMDSREVLARFEAERQALALMEHPNIARVLDAGQTPSGRPFFVMELVKGRPITKYCDEQRLGVRERLALFADVCRAVQHAHQKGVIHRDLKPSNILVAPYDGKPVVKVIDFGVAKATGQRLTDRTLFTGFGALVGTPEYMSPEQAEANNLDIDTRSDVYALGVLLYELLTGSTPLTRQRVREAALMDVLRAIREEEPPRPSTRLSESRDTLPAISAQRQTEPARLTRQVRGELDWVVMKALEKDRGRRYETASAFAADVERYLADEPVLACPPSAGYRLRKFVRRHRGPVLAASLTVVLLGAGTAGTTAGLVRALGERDQKEQALRQVETERDQKQENWRQARQALRMMTNEVVEDLLGSQVQLTERHRDFLRTVLARHIDLAAARADDAEGRQSQAEGYFDVGLIRQRLGELKEAEAAYRTALALQKELADRFPARPEYRYDLALTQSNLGSLLHDTGRPDEAEKFYQASLALRRGLVAEVPGRPEYRHELIGGLTNLGRLLAATGRRDKAEAAFREALARSKQLAADCPKQPEFRGDLARSHNSLAVLLCESGAVAAAEAAWRDAVADDRRLTLAFPKVPDYQNNLAVALMNLGNLLQDSEQPKKAAAAYDEALALGKRLAAEFPSRPGFREDLAVCQYNRAMLLHKTNRQKETQAALGEALAMLRQLAADFPQRIDFRNSLAKSCTGAGVVWHAAGQPDKAEAALGEALALLKPLAAEFPNRPEFRQTLALAYNGLGILRRDLGRPDDAEAAWNEGLKLQKKLVKDFPDRPDYRSQLAGSLYNLAVLLDKNRRPKDAEAAWAHALALHKKLAADFPGDPSHADGQAATLAALAPLLLVTGRADEAEKACDEAVTIGKRLTAAFPDRPAFRQGLALTFNNLGVVLHSRQREAEAEAAFKDALAVWDRLVDEFPEQPFFRQKQARTYSNLGSVQNARHRPREAEAAFSRSLAVWKKLAEDFPRRLDFRQELARSYDNFGRWLHAARRGPEGEKAWRDCLAVCEQSVADFPKVADLRNDLAGTLVNLAGLHRQRREYAAALALLEQARPHHQAALAAQPAHPTYRQFYRNYLLALAGCRQGLKDHAQVADVADELARFGYDPAKDTYHAAALLGRCALLADETRRKELARTYADRSLALLHQAVARGYKDAAFLKQDRSLEPLRARAEFQALLAKLEEKQKD
jgi:serine/threonine protein kinase/tetratricopeptide (TPR) repeat protein